MWLQKLREYFQDASCLIYPNLCLNCQSELPQKIDLLCLRCLNSLSHTSFHKDPKYNLLHKASADFYKFEYMLAYFFFEKRSPIQTLLHKLKYEGQEYIGHVLGQWYANLILTESVFWQEIDLITVVPLSPDKKTTRGYNQNSQFAQVLAQNLAIPLDENILISKAKQKSQVHLSRLDRWQNIKDVYKSHQDKQLDGKHILIVDDVFTTGVTLEVCAKALEQHYDLKISVLTIASADKF